MLSFAFGETLSKGESVILNDYPSIKLSLIKGLRVSGELGFPRLSIQTNVSGPKFNAISSNTYDLEIDEMNKMELHVKNKVAISLTVVIETMAQ
jgi:hypothetical protein